MRERRPLTEGRRTFDRESIVTWLIVAMITAAITLFSTSNSLARYHEFRSGWAWDLAYYNQWFWALTCGDRQITVRPLASYAEEGPSVWKMNYLAPIRFVLAPFYRFYPDPRTLLVIQNVMFWWVIPAAFTLVRAESGSRWLGVAAATMVPLTPLLWPLALNDFRELQLGLPFVLWAVQGVRSRSLPLATLGIAGMLACRQEFALMAATFALIPPRRPEPLSQALKWRHLIVFTGLAWLFFGFFVYLRFTAGSNAPAFYIQQFLGKKASIAATAQTSLNAVAYGLGLWAILACFAPRVAILALPWIWGPCSGQWSIDGLSTSDWHHVRYALPMTALVLAAGLVGFARLGTWLFNRPGRFAWAVAAFAVFILSGSAGIYGMKQRMDRIPVSIAPSEAVELWPLINRAGPDAGVLADHRVSGPLSSRSRLYSYLVNWNLPPRYPKLGSGIQWLFIGNDYPLLKALLDQGFEVQHRGETLTVARRHETP